MPSAGIMTRKRPREENCQNICEFLRTYDKKYFFPFTYDMADKCDTVAFWKTMWVDAKYCTNSQITLQLFGGM